MEQCEKFNIKPFSNYTLEFGKNLITEIAEECRSGTMLWKFQTFEKTVAEPDDYLKLNIMKWSNASNFPKITANQVAR